MATLSVRTGSLSGGDGSFKHEGPYSMNSSYDDPVAERSTPTHSEGELPVLKSGICILIEDSMNQRLVESACLQIDIETNVLNPRRFQIDDIIESELIVADQPTAENIRLILSKRERAEEGVNPGIVVVVPGPVPNPIKDKLEGVLDGGTAESKGRPYDGLLVLPQLPSQLAAQLGLLLYAHRAYVRRFRDALEELHLNRRIFRSVTSGISVANATLPDIPLVYVNPAFEAMTGYSLEEVQGKNCRFLQGNECDQAAIALVREALVNKRETTVVLKNFRKDGTPFWNELSLSPIRNRDGGVTHFVGIQTDVTARIEFEDALRESEKLAAVGRLASSIAHEINNPLESVMNLIYLAKLSNSQADIRTYLATADSELQRVKLITTQSLRFFKQSTKPQAVHCSDLVASVLDLYQPRLLNSGVTVDRRELCHESIVCMESEIRQVLHNLVSNALDAMRSKGGRLLVRTRKGTEHRSGAEGILFTFADTGHGIDPETVKSIYKAFYTTKGIGGTGLGLWISSEIIDRHKGRIIVRSRSTGSKTGTVFQVFLPYQGVGS